MGRVPVPEIMIAATYVGAQLAARVVVIAAFDEEVLVAVVARG